jgi:hypothetical protein
MTVYTALNEKPRLWVPGLDGAGRRLYARDASRGAGKIAAWEGRCQIFPTSQLGNPGRGNNAQETLNPSRGSQPLGAQRVAEKREWHRETGKSRPQQGGSVSHNLCTMAVGVLRLNAVQSSPSVISFWEET